MPAGARQRSRRQRGWPARQRNSSHKSARQLQAHVRRLPGTAHYESLSQKMMVAAQPISVSTSPGIIGSHHCICKQTMLTLAPTSPTIAAARVLSDTPFARATAGVGPPPVAEYTARYAIPEPDASATPPQKITARPPTLADSIQSRAPANAAGDEYARKAIGQAVPCTRATDTCCRNRMMPATLATATKVSTRRSSRIGLIWEGLSSRLTERA